MTVTLTSVIVLHFPNVFLRAAFFSHKYVELLPEDESQIFN